MAAGRNNAAEKREDDLFDQIEVPATVLCALCGDPECPGCANEPSRSGVVALVAWERPGAPVFGRLWGTARATTLDAERFFEMLPDGPIAPALRFAMTCELLASAAMLLGGVIVAAIAAPFWLADAALANGGLLLRALALAVPGIAVLLVAVHAAHGLSLDRGARRAGHRGKTTHALRFGLYSAGWDLLLGPLGAAILAAKEGVRAALRLVNVGVGLPTRSARAFVRGAYHLDARGEGSATSAGQTGAIVLTAIAAAIVLAAIILLFLL